MRARQAALLSLALLGLGGALVACGPSPEQRREAAERERQQRMTRAQLQRCKRDQAAVKRLSDAIARQTTELTKLNAERYESSRRPEPPDPALAARFTQDDRELDELRYREQLRAWEQAEQQRYGRWLDEQNSRRDRLRAQLQADAAVLRRLAPELMAAPGGSTLNTEAVARATRCSPADFGL